MKKSEQAYNATGEAVCLICKNPIPLFSTQAKLYCSRLCGETARKLKTKRWQNCNWCSKRTTHKYCQKACQIRGTDRDRRNKYKYKRTNNHHGGRCNVLPMCGIYGVYSTMPFAMPQLWNTPGLL